MRKFPIIVSGILVCATLLSGCSQNMSNVDKSTVNLNSQNTDNQNQDANNKDSDNQGANNQESNNQESQNPELKNTPTPQIIVLPGDSTIEANEIVAPTITFEQKEIPSNPAITFVHNMKIGWNLGNTFDAVSDSNLMDELNYESSWCGVKTTEEMMKAIKDAGFQSIRIPVSWHNHVSGDDFIISEVWLNRVQEVVDYAINNDMYVILNTHHDVSKNFYYPSNENLESSKKYINAVWTQVSERFSSYGEKLLFEGMNEPRLAGSNYEWWLDLSKPECKEAIECINQLNQEFVDTVRKSGGENTSRYLLIPGYDASSQYALINDYKLPKDNINDRLIVSVHAYLPYDFALKSPKESGSISEWNSKIAGCTKEIDSFLNSLYMKFIKNGVPVIIGEFGARDKENNLESRVEYATYYIGAAKANGITCFWWDNHAFKGDGENFGLFDRKSCTIKYPEILQGLMKYAE
ncbi:glycoside hydrolase family 5 protein [Lachnoclostridium phytofermentans]|nr:glycoside hydrolase family 5 protein [Lachnoclostridium phytofermentans]